MNQEGVVEVDFSAFLEGLPGTPLRIDEGPSPLGLPAPEEARPRRYRRIHNKMSWFLLIRCYGAESDPRFT